MDGWNTIVSGRPGFRCELLVLGRVIYECNHSLVELVSTHLKNMLVKLDHFPNDRGEHWKIFKKPPPKRHLQNFPSLRVFSSLFFVPHRVWSSFCPASICSGSIQARTSDASNSLVATINLFIKGDIEPLGCSRKLGSMVSKWLISPILLKGIYYIGVLTHWS